ncbi:MAG: hypothetical protein WD651_01320 [Acidimicrobiia bacterium]
MFGSRQVLEPVLTKVDQLNTLEELAGRLGDENLTAPTHREHPGAPIKCWAEIIAVPLLCCAHMQGHSDSQGGVGSDLHTEYSHLRRHRRVGRVANTVKRGGEGIPSRGSQNCQRCPDASRLPPSQAPELLSEFSSAAFPLLAEDDC